MNPIAAFHASRRNASVSACRAAHAAGDAVAEEAWAAVSEAHGAAVATPTEENSDRAEQAHRDANRAHPGFPG